MSNQKNLGEFELLVLAALLRLKDNGYGVTIRQEIEHRAGRSVAIGALYATLARLEKKAYVTSKLGGATAERGGRAKRFYQLTALGQEQFNRSLTSIRNMTDGLSAVPGEGAH